MTPTVCLRACRPQCRCGAGAAGRLVLVLALLWPAAGTAQVRAVPPIASLAADLACSATPRLVALSGGGQENLEPGKTIRLPYGVPYRFVHRPGAGTDFVRVALAVGETRTVADAAAAKYDEGCYSVHIGALPGNVPITLVEQVGSFPSEERRRALHAAVDSLRARFIRRLYSGHYDAAMLAHRLGPAVAEDMPALLRSDDFGDLVVRNDEELVPLHATITRRVAAAAAPLAALPGQLNALQAFAGLLGQVPAACTGYCNSSQTRSRAPPPRL